MISFVSFLFFVLTLFVVYVGFYFFLPLLLWMANVFQQWFGRSKAPAASAVPSDYACIVTAYEETAQLPAVVASLLQISGPRFHIYVVADNCDISQLHFGDDRVSVLRPPQVLASNIRSHFYAIDHFVRPHDKLVIIDSDNVVDPLFLVELDRWFALGFQAVQGVRKAKNLNTVIAGLDGARDLFYHYYDGKLLFSLGSSATLSGSGMGFTTQLYEDCLRTQPIQGAGFDKVLQHEIVRRNLRIAYAEKAVLYDEKTAHAEQLVKQRARWINTWFRFFKFGFSLLTQGVLNRSKNQVLFGLVLLRPPLFIFLGLGGALTLLGLCLGHPLWWTGLAAFSAFVFSFVLALYNEKADPRIWRSLYGIPLFVFYQTLSLLKVRKANKHSVATKHFVHSGPPEQP